MLQLIIKLLIMSYALTFYTMDIKNINSNWFNSAENHEIQANSKPMEVLPEKDMLEPMEALDKVKELYAANFEKVMIGEGSDYYYTLPDTNYYLVYEGMEENSANNPGVCLIHLYEFVLDDPETGIGHTVTYGWFRVDLQTGEIIETIA